MTPVGAGGAHLGYCTNIHPGETWAEVRKNLEAHALGVKSRVCPDRPFGLGLRLSGLAVKQLLTGDNIAELKDFLACNGIYVFTINAFPYGRFHGTPVKEAVYLPDWSSPERVEYSNLAARIMAELMPAQDLEYGSVSTVPAAFSDVTEDTAARTTIVHNLIAHAAELVRIEAESGRLVCLAIEPEPCCALETIEETVEFFERHLFVRDAAAEMAKLCGIDGADSEALLRRHIGVCLDACHGAVEFESPGQSVAALQAAGIKIAKAQLSAGLKLNPDTAGAIDNLRLFDEPVYLHQVVERRGSELRRFIDIPHALGAEVKAGTKSLREWRVHFHVPLFREQLAQFENTQAYLRDLLALHRSSPFTKHLEVETYTWDVLPSEFTGEAVEDAVARELLWVVEELAS